MTVAFRVEKNIRLSKLSASINEKDVVVLHIKHERRIDLSDYQSFCQSSNPGNELIYNFTKGHSTDTVINNFRSRVRRDYYVISIRHFRTTVVSVNLPYT